MIEEGNERKGLSSRCDVIESTIKTPSGDNQIDVMLRGRSGHLLTNHWPSDGILATYWEQVKPRGTDCSGRSKMFAAGDVYARIVVPNNWLPEVMRSRPLMFWTFFSLDLIRSETGGERMDWHSFITHLQRQVLLHENDVDCKKPNTAAETCIKSM